MYVYVVSDGRERCSLRQMTEMGVYGVGCQREVYICRFKPSRKSCVYFGPDLDWPMIGDIVLSHL
jgi:hypothetical protein